MIHFEQLDVYRKSIGFAKAIYKTTRSFPRDELFGLTSQLRRASVSVSANIAEGEGRRSYANKIMFYLNSRGSLFECLPLLDIAEAEGYISAENYENYKKTIRDITLLINSTIKTLRTLSQPISK